MSSMLTLISGILVMHSGRVSNLQSAVVPHQRPGNTLQLMEFFVVPVARMPASEMI